MFRESEKNILQICAGDINNGFLYTSFNYFNSACKVDLRDGKTKVYELWNITDNRTIDCFRISGCGGIVSNLLLLPHTGNELCFLNYDFSLREKHTIRNACKVNYNRAHFYKGEIYLLPVFQRDIGCYNPVNRSLIYYDIPRDILELRYNANKEYGIVSSFALNDKIYLLGSNPDILIEFDCEKKQFSYSLSLHGLMSMCYCDGKYFFGTKDGIYCYVGNSFEKGRKIQLPKEFKTSSILPLSSCRNLGGKVVFFSYHANMVLLVDAENETCEELVLPRDDFVVSDDYKRCGSSLVGIDGNTLWLFSPSRTELLQCNVQENSYTSLPLLFKNDEVMRLLGQTNTEDIIEGNLSSFIKFLKARS